MRVWIVVLLALALRGVAARVPVSYTLPADGPLPRTYRVTLAIVDAKNPRWIISQFVCGAPRTVTADNKGAFVDTWNGLDDNFMPVPPGTYALKGIYMPASQWRVDGEYHSVTPRFVGGASAFLPSPAQFNTPEPFGGDPCGCPLGDVDVGPNGIANFYYIYLENGLNNPLIDLKKPLGYGQFTRAFGSGGAAGGTSTCTDGDTVWSFSTDGGAKYVYRADGRPFGSGRAQRAGVYIPDGWVKAMACARAGDKTLVYIAQGGKMVQRKEWPFYFESDTERVDTVTVHDGANGTILARVPVANPRGVVARGGMLYVLHADGDRWAVSAAPLTNGLPGALQPRVALPAGSVPADVEVDSHGRIYVSDAKANKVFQFDAAGKLQRTYGKLAAQVPGRYDPQSFCVPGKLATWTDLEGKDRLLIVEDAGPNRVSEWGADDGTLLREFPSLQTKANDGYAVDPERPSDIYMAGHQGWLTSYKVDYATGAWTVSAVWPDALNDPKAPGLDHPWMIVRNGQRYLACGRSNNIYRLTADGRWLLSAALLREKDGNGWKYLAWHDANGDGKIANDECAPLAVPGWIFRYHGNQWASDLSLLSPAQNDRSVWRLAPDGFDAHGNPIFSKFVKVVTDPVFAARAAGTATALYGGNEMAESYGSDWAMADGTPQEGYVVTARGGPNFSANEGGQEKVSRYAPDGTLLWRAGRKALGGPAAPGDTQAAIHIYKPINGLTSVVDQSRCGVLLYSDEGLFVDAIFPDGRRFSPDKAGVYVQPGEFFAGLVYPNRDNGKIYFGMGKYTPMLFEAEGWSLQETPVRKLTTLPKSVTISADQIAAPPEIALTMRGGAGSARLARFAPALGGANLDGSLLGWESCEPIRFAADKEQTVEVRALYDPGTLYLRIQAHFASKFDAKPLQPIERIFTHDRLSDTVSLYLQGDPQALPGKSPNGRLGDVRIVFGVFTDGGKLVPAALGLYPVWPGAKANPLTFRTPVNEVRFQHVGPVEGAVLHAVLDADGKGWTLTAAIPRAAVPDLPALGADLRTMVNFEATFAGHNKFWWSNADGSASRETYDEPTEARLYPGSWAPAQFVGLAQGVVVQNWQICGPFGGPGVEKFGWDPNGPVPGTNKEMKQAVAEVCAALKTPLDDGAVDLAATFTGPAVQGYWPNPGVVRWRPARVADLDTRILLGGGAQVYHAVTWIYAPKETTVDARYQGHPMTRYRWTLNGALQHDGEIRGEPGAATLVKPLTLRQGWNTIAVRAFGYGYPVARAGLVLTAPPDVLWTLRLSGNPPK
jgi:hypothetical protein